MTDAGSDPNLFALRERGERAPLFLICEPGVNALGYTALVRHLPGDQPAYVVQPKGGGRAFPDEGIGTGGRDEHAVVAAEYLASVRGVQPRGPYQLAGMCDGALIAFHLARLLEAEGERVALLAVIDTWPLESTSIRPLVLAKIVLRSRRARRAAQKRAGGGAGAQRPLGRREPSMPAQEHRARWSAKLWPGRRFEPPAIDAPIAVLRVPGQPYWRIHDDALGWRSRTHGAVTVHIVPGDHRRLLRSPYVEELARALAGYLDTGAARPAEAPRARAGSAAALAPQGPRPALPPVSCVCLTYERARFLREAVASFLAQDYPGPKELVVLNDYEDQTFALDHPEVRVVNAERRYRTLGDKRNAALALCSHDTVLVWDDDDISLPHRISLSMRRLDPRVGLWRPENAWIWDGRSLREASGGHHAASCFSRRLVDAAGGYPPGGAGVEARLDRRLARLVPGGVKAEKLAPEEIVCVLRRVPDTYHMSHHAGPTAGENAGHAEVAAFVRRRAERGQIRQGLITLAPGFRSDFPAIVARHLRERATAKGRLLAAGALAREHAARAAKRGIRAIQAGAGWLGALDLDVS